MHPVTSQTFDFRKETQHAPKTISMFRNHPRILRHDIPVRGDFDTPQTMAGPDLIYSFAENSCSRITFTFLAER
ncbi:hypothetical protein GWI33_019422 [Rhynchophorus ferrugineus]|uniref:Uncharacterized protein n=1 Tax=Rhynchophorus ferrugineus TaxID=354439 RepID=A0A834HUF6_RHYFE|nr:hypothetical protein GWI33_019422 [Rhynchophorus ferrugineus]